MRKVAVVLAVFIPSLLLLFWGFPPTNIVLELRLPELLLSFGFGGSLSAAGGVFQGTLKNPLAEPYTLGTAAGAALGAAVASVFRFPVEWGALVGGLLSVFFIVLSFRVFSDPLSVLLFGVGLTAFFSASILFLYALFPVYTLQEALLFTLGYIMPVKISLSLFLFVVSLVSLALLIFRSRNLDLISLGDETAFFSGVDPKRERFLLFLISSVPVSLFVAYCGVIGFVGIVVPHAVRFLGYRTGKLLLPVSFLVGGGALSLSQWLARTLLYPTVLPAGVITALLGVPLFLYILWRYTGGRG